MTYKLTEYGLVAQFQQACGCNAEGPKCKEGRRLYKEMSKQSAQLFHEKITLAEADVTLNAWLTHLGA